MRASPSGSVARAVTVTTSPWAAVQCFPAPSSPTRPWISGRRFFKVMSTFLNRPRMPGPFTRTLRLTFSIAACSVKGPAEGSPGRM